MRRRASQFTIIIMAIMTTVRRVHAVTKHWIRVIRSQPAQTTLTNGIDDVSTTTPAGMKVEHENVFRCSSPMSPTSQVTQPIIPTKITLTTALPVSSSSANTSKRSIGTLNRLLHSVTSRTNGHSYHHLNGSSSPSASSSTTITTTPAVDSTAKDPKTSLELTTQSIESKSTSPSIDFSIYSSLFCSFCPTFW